MKKRFKVIFAALVIVMCIAPTSLVFAEDTISSEGKETYGTSEEIIVEKVDPTEGEQENVYGSGGSDEGTASKNEVLGDILNGEDKASDLFGTDKFKPTAVDNSWSDGFIRWVGVLASSACGFFGAYIMASFVIDILIMLIPAFGNLIIHLHLGWLISDTCKSLNKLTTREGEELPAIPEGVTSKASKIGYWFKERIIISVIAGIVLVGIATGLLPRLINMLVNAGVNGIEWVLNWVKSL